MWCRKTVVCIACFFATLSTFSQQKQWPKTFLWRISGNGLAKPSYLYGTMHLTDKRLFYFSDSLYHYLEQADGFNIELDADSLVSFSMRKFVEKDNGRLLKSLLKKDEYDKYAQKLSKTLNKPADRITTKDIWLAKNKKTADAYKQGDMSNFMDLYLYGLAKKQGKVVGGIEDIEDQMDAIDEVFNEMDIEYVVSDTMQESGRSTLEKMKNIYVRQDLNDVYALFNTGYNDRFKDVILLKRNVKMARRMDSIAHERSCFFAVGVAHLPGDSGVIDLLQKRGFKVEPVMSVKKLAPESYVVKEVAVPWRNYKHELNLYNVDVPGSMQPFDVYKQVMDMQYYYDIANAKVYYTAVINSVTNITKKDSIFSTMIARMTGAGKLVSKSNIEKQSYEGRDVTIKTSTNEVLRLNVFMAQGLVYMAMVSGKSSDKTLDKDTKRFFESFSMTPAAIPATSFADFNDAASAFSVRLPAKPFIREQADNVEQEGSVKEFSVSDYKTGNYYFITVRDTKPGSYYADDTSYFKVIRQNLKEAVTIDTSIPNTTFQGYPALRVSGPVKKDATFLYTLNVIRGNRTYYLACVTSKDGSKKALVDSFFNSFKLVDYTYQPWSTYAAPDNSFKAWLPDSILTRENAEKANDGLDATQKKTKHNFLSYDKSTATSYHIERSTFSSYYWAESPKEFFEEASRTYKAEGDTMVVFRTTKAGEDHAADVSLENPNTSIVKKIRFILHGDTLYKAFTYSPKWLVNNGNTDKFLNDFFISSPAKPTTLLSNKTQQLVADLLSTDSSTFEKASDYLYDAAFKKSDLPALHGLMIKPLKDFSESSYNTNNRLINKIVDVADSSTIQFVLQQYPLLKGENAKLQSPLLSLLVKIDKPYSINAVNTLLNSGAPAGAQSILASALRQKLNAAKILYPKLIAFTADTSNALEYASLVTKLIDSNRISRSDVVPYLENFVKASEHERKKITTADDDDYNLSNVEDLFGTMNTEQTNTQLQLLSRSNSLYISNNAVNWLLRNKQPVPTDAIARLAASDQFRTAVYDTLKALKKVNLFPSTFLNQRMFAASYVFTSATDEEYDPKKVSYVKDIIVTDKGKKEKYYLFKVTIDEDESLSDYLGVAGPFSIDATKVTSKNTSTGLFSNEKFSAKKVDYLFGEYMKQLEAND